MLIYLYSIVLLISISSSIAIAQEDCTYSWASNPKKDKILYYTLYNNRTVIADKITGLSIVLPCTQGRFSVTATNKFGESEKSSSIRADAPSPPTKIKVYK